RRPSGVSPCPTCRSPTAARSSRPSSRRWRTSWTRRAPSWTRGSRSAARMTPVTLPDAAWDDVDEGEEAEARLDAWLVAPGDQVAAAQPLAVAILVKTSCEVTAPVAGRVARILVAAQETFGRGRVLAEIEEAEAAHAGAARPPAAGAAPPAPAGAAGPDAARADRGVRRTPLAGLRGVVARSLTAAWQGAPRVAVAVEVDMTASLARPAALARQLGASPRVSVTHLVLRAAALSLREHPRLNGRVAGDAVETSDAVHVGLAVDVDEAVVVPVVRDADRKSVAELAA